MISIIRISSCLSFICLCFASAKSQGLSNEDSVDIYIARLNWESFGDNGQYVRQLVLGEDANRLIRLKAHTKTQKLIRHLADTEKTAVIHQILVRLFDGEHWSYKENYIPGKDSTWTIVYTFNGLTWTRDNRWRPTITQDEVRNIQQYWQRRYYNEKVKIKPKVVLDTIPRIRMP